jgi:hypothetical protein
VWCSPLQRERVRERGSLELKKRKILFDRLNELVV